MRDGRARRRADGTCCGGTRRRQVTSLVAALVVTAGACGGVTTWPGTTTTTGATATTTTTTLPGGGGALTLLPESITTTKGATGGQPVGNLAVRDQSGVTVDPTRSVIFGPGAYAGYRTYRLPAGVDPASIWGVTVSAGYLGPDKATQRWRWYMYDWSTGSWVSLGDNAEAPDSGPWQPLTFYAGGDLADYVEPATGAIRVRLVSPNKPYVAALDDESVVVDHGPLPVHPGWKPEVGSRFQIQLQDSIDTSLCVVPYTGGACVRPEVYEFDLYSPDGVTPDAAAVDAVHAAGARAICYVSAGSWEDWRPDAGAYPESVKGHSNGWPGEKWLDIRRTDVLLPIIDARLAACAAAGFDGVELDNVDGYTNGTGFPLTASQQVVFNRSIADLAHDHGLSVALKNDVEQLVQLLPWFDYAVNEQCQQYSECGGYDLWIGEGRAVFQIEYSAGLSATCNAANAAGRSAIRKSLDLRALPWTPCD